MFCIRQIGEKLKLNIIVSIEYKSLVAVVVEFDDVTLVVDDVFSHSIHSIPSYSNLHREIHNH